MPTATPGLPNSSRLLVSDALRRWKLTHLALALLLQAGSGWAAEAAGPSWNSLSPGQRQVLAPLSQDWDSLDLERKQKWIEISQRFPSMTPERQQRVQQRMVEWARMSPKQRSDARNNFQRSKQLPAEERQAQWEAYQALPPEQRQALAERSRPNDRAEERARRKALRDASVDAQERKSNIVSGSQAPLPPRPVAPMVIQGNPGATTSLINRPPSPPVHQQAGLPKIGAGNGMVDRNTLLPRVGPQGAAMRPASPASGDKR